jgi:hypothetical protein
MAMSATKAEKFQKFLKDQEITIFEEEKFDDDFHSMAFRSRIEVEGQFLPTVIVLDDSIYSLIRVQVMNKTTKEVNQKELLDHINKLNAKYKVFKYYIADDGALILDCCVPSSVDGFEGELIRMILDVIVKHILEDYPALMRLVWGKGK